jgi:hypothetical protein
MINPPKLETIKLPTKEDLFNNVEQACLNIDALASSCLVGWDHNICCQTQQSLEFKDIFIRHGSDN